MPNQLSIPFKKTYVIPIRQSVRDYILKHHPDTHPDAFKWDINRWEDLRRDGVGGLVHIERVKAATSYHAQLAFILTKLPTDIGLEIPYAPAFNSNAIPITLSNLVYERAAVLFNLAALYCQLAASEDRTKAQGLKQTVAFYQHAAGTLRYLLSTVVPKLETSLSQDDYPLDFQSAFISSLEALMLAQGQEAVWQKAVLEQYKNGVIAKLSIKVAAYYAESLTSLQQAPASIRVLFPSGWLVHLEVKQLHFEAAAQYRKSIDDLEANRYGDEIARLTLAKSLANKAHEIARRGSIASAVIHDAKSLLGTVDKNLTRAERDNNYIYHHEVPSLSTLPAIAEVSMVQSVHIEALEDPKKVIGNEPIIFGELLGWGAKVAIEIYNDRRENWLKEEVIERAQQLDDTAIETLQTLNLPASLEALERPIGLPPSLLKKAEEVRSEEGPSKVQSSIENVRKLAQRNMALLDEAMDVLDQEAEEDEVFQEDAPGTRLPSVEANKDLIARAQRYRNILQQATDSDAVVRGKWEEWGQNIIELTWDPSELEASIPSSTVSQSPTKRSSRRADPTQGHARQLRVLLESLDDIQRSRAQLVNRAKRLALSEDITPRILKAASAIERWKEVQPSMFEDVLDEELEKYEKFREEVEEGEQKQEVLLDSLRERNTLFIQSRKEDPSIKEREHALQSLDLAYHKYKEITRNLDEGVKFYNDFGEILTQFKLTCKDWARQRQGEMLSMTLALQSLALEDPLSKAQQAAELSNELASPAYSTRFTRPTFDLPPPDSDAWETMVLPPAPNVNRLARNP